MEKNSFSHCRLRTAGLLMLFFFACRPLSAQHIDLSGSWHFGIDREGSLAPDAPLHQRVKLPGSMLTNRQGDPVTTDTRWTASIYDSSFFFNPHMERYRKAGQVKLPFCLTPDRYYVGNAWYRRSVNIPKHWRKRRVVLYLERPHIETTLYVNGLEVGHRMSLSVAHEYDITDYVRFGRHNTIAIKVYNGIENVCVGQDSHSVTDQTQGNWNGIVGRIELQSRPAHGILQYRVVPHLADSTVSVALTLGDLGGSNPLKKKAKTPVPAHRELHFELTGPDGQPLPAPTPHMLTRADSALTVEIDLHGHMQTWDEFHPNLYRLDAVIGDDTTHINFGVREIKAEGRQLVLNGTPIWMRGTVGNCCFPETGFPPTDVEAWEGIFRQCRNYGLNLMRFHSYCPPEAAFTAADRVGFYLQPEGPSWPNHGVKLRNKMPIDDYLLQECKDIVDRYGHHPSFVLMAAGNEPAGGWVAWGNDFVKTMHRHDSTRLYCAASVGGGWAWDDGSEFHVKGGARGLDWDNHAPHSDDDFYSQMLEPRNYKPTRGETENNTPILGHEVGQWCAFPDLDERADYTGVYKPRNFDIFEDLLQENGMGSRARQFLDASGRLQTLAYKYDIERNLRTPDYAGFELLGLNDYSGQGTALVGVLNVHWREKGYCDAATWRSFCSELVPLAKFPKFVYTTGETLEVPIDLYNATGHEIENGELTYQVEGFTGRTLQATFPLGKTADLVTVRQSLRTVKAPCRLTLTAEIDGHRNSWDFYVYPEKATRDDTTGIYVCHELDSIAIARLDSGGKVLLCAAGKVTYGNDVKHHYLPVFWNTSWFKMRPPHTTGCYIEKGHPAFNLFPTEQWQDVQWWELVNRAQVMNMSEFPEDFQPIVQPIDTWHLSRKLGMLFEARVGQGSLLMTTLDISTDLHRRVAARQLRTSLLTYMRSMAFHPTTEIALSTVQNLFEKVAPPANLFTKDSPDELKPALKP